MVKFLLSSENNKELSSKFSNCLNIGSDQYLFIEGKFKTFDNCNIIIDGFVAPRNHCYKEYKTLDQYELIYFLYKKYGTDFPKHLKGFFCIVVSENDKICIANDIHSVKRFYTANKDVYISNNIETLKIVTTLKHNSYSPAIFAVLQHFIKGISLFDNVEYSIPATLTIVDKGNITKTIYWNPQILSDSKKDLTTQEEFINTFDISVKNYLEYLNPTNVSTTLTGGRDTRTVLSSLLNNGIKPHCFTFGYPTGTDVTTAKNVADICSLDFSNHYIENLDSKKYSELVNKIVDSENHFIHIHRAHRLDAIIKESNYFNNDLDMVFVGAMGGDYIMGENFNDYIITEFIRRFLTEEMSQKEIVSQILDKHYIKYDDSTINYIINLLEEFGLRHNTFNKNIEFNLVHNLIGCTHDIQDINLFMEHSKYVIAPFMDIDIMESLFSSPFSLFSNNRHTKNPIKRLRGGELQCKLIKKYSPFLADVPFANRYTPNDVLGNRIKYIIKRSIIQLTSEKSKPTFSYDKWFIEYVKSELINLNEDIKSEYDIHKMINDIDTDMHANHEGYWHKYSNPITLSKYLQKTI